VLGMKAQANIVNMDLCGVCISLTHRRPDYMSKERKGTILDALS
jgi:hypothetical protein